MASYREFKTQRQAIADAAASARDWAEDNKEPMTADVLLWSGDTLHITSTQDGKLSRRITAGWERHGVLFCSRKTASLAMKGP